METLRLINPHPRDDEIQFFEIGHKYKILSDPNSKYTSVTTFIHSLFPKFDADKVIKNIKNGKNWNEDNKYWGMSDKEIKDQWSQNGKQSAELGTKMHYDIEQFMNTPTDEVKNANQQFILKIDKHKHSEKEWVMFKDFVDKYPDLVPYRTEWLVFDHETKLAGSIDMVYLNEDGSVSIYDWKRCKDIKYDSDWKDRGLNLAVKHLPNTNYWHYSLQLNVYRKLLMKNYGLQVKELFLVQIHPDNNSFELHEVKILDKEVNDLFEQRTKLK